ncbi:uracil phosphoribosyltransferase [Verticillium alfalfae VaMs.102]|uniref:Uracil phosphoribosyltransferase n=1 Tax=Verticillium alfalfae (strain VaMs.102 / ATCC MYA-4576 / FGSC 10136) TaxID=526221 RepID=C9S891_VERA1|nr:uracil phosphoribosyltransferase [Verticillium alfalfae VaMs.102]EEY13901.1 uracil phosphoribosyltransferase [Verticillium alfalfae VaMs.102]
MASQPAKLQKPSGAVQCVGPLYRSESQKPSATVSTEMNLDNVHILPQTPQLIALLTYVFGIPQAIAAHCLYATSGGSAIMAVEVLKSRGVLEERILFLNLIASPEGVRAFTSKFPKLRVVTAFVDEGLDEKNYIVPGLGDFGDRFYTM